jgi:hypothetical protein
MMTFSQAFELAPPASHRHRFYRKSEAEPMGFCAPQGLNVGFPALELAEPSSSFGVRVVVGVRVGLGVRVGVGVSVGVDVTVAVGVMVGVGEAVGVKVAVAEGDEIRVGVKVAGMVEVGKVAVLAVGTRMPDSSEFPSQRPANMIMVRRPTITQICFADSRAAVGCALRLGWAAVGVMAGLVAG